MDRLLCEKDTARGAGQWLLDTGLLEYLQVALKVEATDTGDWAPFINAQELPYSPAVSGQGKELLTSVP